MLDAILYWARKPEDKLNSAPICIPIRPLLELLIYVASVKAQFLFLTKLSCFLSCIHMKDIYMLYNIIYLWILRLFRRDEVFVRFLWPWLCSRNSKNRPV